MPNLDERTALRAYRRETRDNYSDIIDLPYPRNDWNFLMKYPRMSVEDRAKIFHPFAALRGHAEALDATAERKQTAIENELSLDENEFGA